MTEADDAIAAGMAAIELSRAKIANLNSVRDGAPGRLRAHVGGASDDQR